MKSPVVVLSFPWKCNGCRICQLVCSFKHYKVNNPAKSCIKVLRLEPGIDSPLTCYHCMKPPCMERCPQKAVSKDPTTGWVSVDENKCIGCGLCVEACPRGVITLEPDSGAIICDLCDGSPECVAFCPTNALEFGPLKILAQKRHVEWTKLYAKLGGDNHA